MKHLKKLDAIAGKLKTFSLFDRKKKKDPQHKGNIKIPEYLNKKEKNRITSVELSDTLRKFVDEEFIGMLSANSVEDAEDRLYDAFIVLLHLLTEHEIDIPRMLARNAYFDKNPFTITRDTVIGKLLLHDREDVEGLSDEVYEVIDHYIDMDDITRGKVMGVHNAIYKFDYESYGLERIAERLAAKDSDAKDGDIELPLAYARLFGFYFGLCVFRKMMDFFKVENVQAFIRKETDLAKATKRTKTKDVEQGEREDLVDDTASTIKTPSEIRKINQQFTSGVSYTPVHFALSDFDSPDEPGSGSKMDAGLLQMLDKVREKLGIPLRINSGYRSPKHNSRLSSSVKNSAHTMGKAVDISTRNMSHEKKREMVRLFKEMGITRFGIGRTYVHVDNDATKPQNVVWSYGNPVGDLDPFKMA
jgi:uncharacterized protein YcbK (DUF882 family)